MSESAAEIETPLTLETPAQLKLQPDPDPKPEPIRTLPQDLIEDLQSLAAKACNLYDLDLPADEFKTQLPDQKFYSLLIDEIRKLMLLTEPEEEEIHWQVTSFQDVLKRLHSICKLTPEELINTLVTPKEGQDPDKRLQYINHVLNYTRARLFNFLSKLGHTNVKI